VTRFRPLTPASDPEGDYDYASGGEEKPEKLIINEVLHSMISQAEQAPDVRLVGPDASYQEEEDEEEEDEEDKEEGE
jgi:cellobiose-specific phosphotransferase system component IIB